MRVSVRSLNLATVWERRGLSVRSAEIPNDPALPFAVSWVLVGSNSKHVIDACVMVWLEPVRLAMTSMDTGPSARDFLRRLEGGASRRAAWPYVSSLKSRNSARALGSAVYVSCINSFCASELQIIKMPKATVSKKAKSGLDPLHVQLKSDEVFSKYGKVSQPGKRSKQRKRGMEDDEVRESSRSLDLH